MTWEQTETEQEILWTTKSQSGSYFLIVGSNDSGWWYEIHRTKNMKSSSGGYTTRLESMIRAETILRLLLVVDLQYNVMLPLGVI